MNRKYILLLFLMLCIPFTIKAQVLMGLLFGDKLNSEKIEFGLVVGLNYSNLTHQPDTKLLSGFKFGSNFYFKLDERKYIHLELLAYNDHGAKNIPVYSLGDEDLDRVLTDAEVTRRLRYAGARILFRYRIFNYFFAELGPAFSLLPNAFDEFKKTNGDHEIIVKNNITSDYNRIDIGPVAVLSYKLLKGEGMSLYIGYYHGLTNTEKKSNIKNSSFQLGVDFPIGKSK